MLREVFFGNKHVPPGGSRLLARLLKRNIYLLHHPKKLSVRCGAQGSKIKGKCHRVSHRPPGQHRPVYSYYQTYPRQRSLTNCAPYANNTNESSSPSKRSSKRSTKKKLLRSGKRTLGSADL